MRVAFGCDHAGFPFRPVVQRVLDQLGHEMDDQGCYSPEPCDYPDYALAVARRVAAGEADRGVVVCGTGFGSAIAANKVAGIRAATVSEPVGARYAREHNDVNVLALGARLTGPELAAEIIRVFLNTEFSGEERHRRRLNKIREAERLAPIPVPAEEAAS